MAGRNVDFVNTIPGRCALSVNHPNSPAPPGWAWIKLTDLAKLESGHTPSRNHPEYWDGDIAWIGIKDAREHHTGVIHDTLQHVTQAGIDNSAARLLPAHTVCLSRTASVGYVVVMGCPMATSQDFVNWVCTPALEPDYLKWLLLAEGEDGLRKFGKGSTHTTIYFPEVQAFHACVAPLNEQRRIVAKLDAIFEQTRAARARLERLPALLEKLKRSILAAAFRGELTKDWRAAHPDVKAASVLLDRIRAERRCRWDQTLRAKGKDPTRATYEEPAAVDTDALPPLPKSWVWVRLPEFGEVARGRSRHRPRNEPALFGDHVPFIQTGEVSRSGGRITTWTTMYSEFGLAQSRLFPAGTVCITIAANIAESGVLCFDACFPDSVVGVSVDERLAQPTFVEFFIRVARGDLARFAPATAQANINLEILGDVAVPLPPRSEIEEIVRTLNEADSAIGEITRRAAQALERITRIERATLAKAFRGELVPQDPTDEPAAALLDRIPAARAAEPTAPPRARTAPRSERSPAAAHTNGHTAAPREDALDLVIAAFQQGESRLGATAITEATGLDATAVKRALATLVNSGQVRVHGRARGTTYEWAT